MIATRVIPLKIRYIIFLVIFFLITWQIYKYTFDSMKDTFGLKNRNVSIPMSV